MESWTYQIFPSITLLSTDGIITFCRVTIFSNGCISPERRSVRVTLVLAGPRITWTASFTVKSEISLPLTFVITSPLKRPNSFAGDPAMILSIFTPRSCLSITAQIPSKSPLSASLNFFVSSKSKYSLCLSFKASIMPFIAPMERSFLETFSNPI